MMGKRVYHHPVPFACNADCVFCISKEQTPARFREAGYPSPGWRANLSKTLDGNRFREVEITGGGEPFLDPERLSVTISMIRSSWPETKIKLYTNGFSPAAIPLVDEINLSRVHPDAGTNDRFMRPAAVGYRDLVDAVSALRPFCRVLRVQTVLLRNAIDSGEKVRSLLDDPALSGVDVFMFRELFFECGRAASSRVPLDRVAGGQWPDRVKWDRQERPCLDYPFICAEGKLHGSWRAAWAGNEKDPAVKQGSF